MVKVKKTIEIKKIKILDEIYPRVQLNWQTSYDYAESMKSGAKFPPIVIGLYKGNYVLIDGYHRIEAKKLNKEQKIQAEIHTNIDKKKMFEMAIKLNISHGKTLTPYEKRKIALRLREMKYPNSKVSELIQIPLNKLDNFVGQRLVNTITGETIVKSGVKHFAGKNLPENISKNLEESENKMIVVDQVKFINQLIDLIKKGFIDIENEKVARKIEELKELI
ncbi:MAG: ParB N-terminal domain-containing protein [Minisyncoccales bacterium]